MKYKPSEVPVELLYEITPDEGTPLTLEIDYEASERVWREWLKRIEEEDPAAYQEIIFQM